MVKEDDQSDVPLVLEGFLVGCAIYQSNQRLVRAAQVVKATTEDELAKGAANHAWLRVANLQLEILNILWLDLKLLRQQIEQQRVVTLRHGTRRCRDSTSTVEAVRDNRIEHACDSGWMKFIKSYQHPEGDA